MSTARRRTATRLADGRELIYFDDSPEFLSGEREHRLDDPRPLADRFSPVPDADGVPQPFTGPQMRRDPLTGDWIPLASHRMNRTFLPAADSCPLCPARPDAEYADGEIPDTHYDVAVFENRFPSLMRVPGQDADGQGVAAPADTVPDDPRDLLEVAAPAAGRCEVICFSSDHRTSVVDLPVSRIRTIVDAWADRTTALGAEAGIQQVFCFENRGRDIGVTLPHPHGQIYGYPYLTPRTERLLDQARVYRERTGGNLLRDILHAEQASGERVVLRSEHWTAYVPYAARWPVEVHLAPHRDVGTIPELTDSERDDLAVIYRELLRRADAFFVESDGTPIELPYIAAWHQMPSSRAGRTTTDDGAPLARLHLELFSILRAPGKLKYLAGSESGMGAWISDTTPERIAARFHQLGPVDLSASPASATTANGAHA
ncbi:galactose-1-phosphate uridylyltransferase [Paraoerskovia marina]|uniref:galactose-1-phosphate uridylyltransferase n=1 Tax=Paraoerskovia marina TaxID=545619 RepID=UPI0006939579|nr:galactose-1-phosphate uridylyltransferase [Paraoerskovia marina]